MVTAAGAANLTPLTTEPITERPTGTDRSGAIALGKEDPCSAPTALLQYSGVGRIVYRVMESDREQRPWLIDLATALPDSGQHPGRPVYDDATQMTYVREPTREPAIDSAASIATKKADRETGEDQKGF